TRSLWFFRENLSYFLERCRREQNFVTFTSPSEFASESSLTQPKFMAQPRPFPHFPDQIGSEISLWPSWSHISAPRRCSLGARPGRRWLRESSVRFAELADSINRFASCAGSSAADSCCGSRRGRSSGASTCLSP